MKTTIPFGYDPNKPNATHVNKITIEYCQCNDELLTIETEDEGAGAFMIIKSEKWSADFGEIENIIKDFKERAGI